MRYEINQQMHAYLEQANRIHNAQRRIAEANTELESCQKERTAIRTRLNQLVNTRCLIPLGNGMTFYVEGRLCGVATVAVFNEAGEEVDLRGNASHAAENK